MLTLNKTKAALQSCQCQNTKLKHPQNSTLIDQVNSGYTRSFVTHYLGIAGGVVNQRFVLLRCTAMPHTPEALFSASVEGMVILTTPFTPRMRFCILKTNQCVKGYYSALYNRLKIEPADLIQLFDSISRCSFCFALSRFVASARIATKINFEEVSHSYFTSSTKSITSCGTRKVTERDFEFTGPVGISASSLYWCKTIYTKNYLKEGLRCKALCASFVLHLIVRKVQKTKPGSAPTHTGPLTTTVSESNEAAMKDHITHPQGRNNYTWRFLAINRHDRKAKPCRLSVEAETECEARRILAPHFILSLAARLPIQEVRRG
ncbi:host cell division inhibitor Icd-like protein [Pectobacterium carotovorum subsp. carotovorum]|nr:host cell division inhibitor Icd-like protein [Pectobacterium carotovorum]MCL6363759.1 host cell division inhibitor Icd-like protein [Pectobacterium carotovorum subsp. carotovorum]